LELENFLTSILEGKQPSVQRHKGKAILKIALESNHNNYFSSPQNRNEKPDIDRFSRSQSPSCGYYSCFNTQGAIADVVSKAKRHVNEVVVIDVDHLT